MFGYLRGTIIYTDLNIVTLEVQGIGLAYDIIVSPTSLQNASIGQLGEFWIHHHRTDMSEVLFGFENTGDRQLFRSLIKVNGVGGKTAIEMLGLGEEALKRAIYLEDDTVLSSVPGIGKKTAQKIIVELKGSIDFDKKISTKKSQDIQSDSILIASLIGMGYDKKRVENVVKDIDASLSIEQRTIQAIQQLAQ